MSAALFTDDAVLLDESEKQVKKSSEFDTVWKRRKLKVNAGKSNVIACEGNSDILQSFDRETRTGESWGLQVPWEQAALRQQPGVRRGSKGWQENCWDFEINNWNQKCKGGGKQDLAW